MDLIQFFWEFHYFERPFWVLSNYLGIFFNYFEGFANFGDIF